MRPGALKVTRCTLLNKPLIVARCLWGEETDSTARGSVTVRQFFVQETPTRHTRPEQYAHSETETQKPLRV